MVGGGLYDQVGFEPLKINPAAPISSAYQINQYEKPVKIITRSDADAVKKYLENRRQKKQQADSWV